MRQEQWLRQQAALPLRQQQERLRQRQELLQQVLQQPELLQQVLQQREQQELLLFVRKQPEQRPAAMRSTMIFSFTDLLNF